MDSEFSFRWSAPPDGWNHGNTDGTNKENTLKWMNKLISLINRVIEKGLANPVNFRRSVNQVIDDLLGDLRSDYEWPLDYFLFRVYESIWTGDEKSPQFEDGPGLATGVWFEEHTAGGIRLKSFKHLHLRPSKNHAHMHLEISAGQFEACNGLLVAEGVDVPDSLDMLMSYVEAALHRDRPRMRFYPLSTWLDTKPATSSLDSPAEPQEKTLMEKIDDLYLYEQPKVSTKKGYKVMPPWSVPMPWNFDKERDIYGNSEAIPLCLQGMTIRVDWPTYSIRPVLTRAQQNRLEETPPDMETAKLHMLGQRMLFACARLNDWVRYMDEIRQVIPLHLYLAGTVPRDDLAFFSYKAGRMLTAGYKAWREDPPGYLECIRPSDFVEDDGDSSSESNLWEEEDRAWGEAHLLEED